MPNFVDIDWQGRLVSIESAWVGSPAPRQDRPPLIFLHEGLGSVSMWRDFPDRLCRALDTRGWVYSRPGYGHSTPRAPGETWRPDFMHRQAHELLPALLEAVGLAGPGVRPWLVGHSDGASIALLHAARFPGALGGVVALAPHIKVEPVSVASIQATRNAYLNTDLRARLARHHADPDSAFWGWNDIWLHPDFRSWTIEAEIGSITCPVLAIQGLDDEYGTLEQVRGIARRLPQTRLIDLPACGHSPHRDQPEAVIEAVSASILNSLDLK